MNVGIVAVVTTYNRLNLLRRCLDAIQHQSTPVMAIVVVNNASTDGTRKFLDSWADAANQNTTDRIPIHMDENTGGAGGFNQGIRTAVKTRACWYWLMDDDVIPTTDALAELLHAARLTNGTQGFYSSVALDESMEQTVNVPGISSTTGLRGYPNWGDHLSSALVRIQTATFVSLLISYDTVLKVGLPIKEFFIWGDDTEFTRRMSQAHFSGYWVGKSRVMHLRPGASTINIRNVQNAERVKLFIFYYRNWTYIAKKTRKPTFFVFLYKSIIDIISLILKHRNPHKALIVMQGLWLGFFFRPHIEYIPPASLPVPTEVHEEERIEIDR